MFWVGLILSLTVFLTGTTPIRDWISFRLPDINQRYLDVYRIVLFLLFSIISVIGYVKTVNEISVLKHIVHPRTFTAAQDKVFLDALRKAPPGIVALFWLSNNLEAEVFAKHLAILLESVGWTVSKRGYEANETPVGVEIHVQSAETAPPYTTTLREALKSVGYQTSIVENRASPIKDWLWLVVGHKL